MKQFILDSNVVSEVWKPRPDALVLRWLQRAEWYLPAPVIAEIQEGAEAVASPVRRKEINAHRDEFLQRYSGLLLDWDAETARTWGRLKHSAEVKRQPQAFWDSLIDAMAVRSGFFIATRNIDDFRHGNTFNPWDGSEQLRR